MARVPGWVTRAEAAEIIGCSDFKVRRWEKEGLLKPTKGKDGVHRFRRTEIEDFRDYLERDAERKRTVGGDEQMGEEPVMVDEDPEDGGGETAAATPGTLVIQKQRQDNVAALVRATSTAIGQNRQQANSLFQFYEDALKDLRTHNKELHEQVVALQAQRGELLTQMEDLASKRMERDLERRIVEQTVLTEEKPAISERMFERTLGPIIPALLHKFLGVKVDLGDPLVQKVRGFFMSLTEEQGAAIWRELRPEQQAALADLMAFVDARTGKSNGEKKAEEKDADGAPASQVTDAEYTEEPPEEPREGDPPPSE